MIKTFHLIKNRAIWDTATALLKTEYKIKPLTQDLLLISNHL
mgnify:CR=1 FL=1